MSTLERKCKLQRVRKLLEEVGNGSCLKFQLVLMCIYYTSQHNEIVVHYSLQLVYRDEDI